MKNNPGALALYASVKAANDDEFGSTLRTEHQGPTEGGARHSSSGWDPFEVWRTRIKSRRVFDALETQVASP